MDDLEKLTSQMDDLKKRKLTSQEIYLLALRQILLNQVDLLRNECAYNTNIKKSENLAQRIKDFLDYKE